MRQQYAIQETNLAPVQKWKTGILCEAGAVLPNTRLGTASGFYGDSACVINAIQKNGYAIL